MRSTWSRCTVAFLGLLLALATPASAQDFNGGRAIHVGDKVTATFDGSTGERHEFTFFANKGTRLDAKVAVTSGTLIPMLRLTYPGGTNLNLRGTRSGFGSRSPSIRGYVFRDSGTYVLAISPESGTGGYSLTTRGKLADRIVGIVPRVKGETTYRFEAIEGATLRATVLPLSGRGPGTSPRISGLTGPDDEPIAITPTNRGRKSRIDGVALGATGAYTLAIMNEGRKGDLRIKLVFTNPNPPRMTHVLGKAAGIPAGCVDRGDPLLPVPPGYVGSGACGKCHSDLFESWSGTAHNLAVRTWNRAGMTGKAFVNDADGNGQDDFRDGLDLATTPAFAQYGDIAPKLLYDANEAIPYRVDIGGVIFPVSRVMGGNGHWKQRYLMQAEGQYFILPVQYNDVTREYAAYHPENWYRSNTLRAYDQPGQISTDLSFEANCSGCHNTGETIIYDAVSDQYKTGYSDYNIGCEQCHGPGGEHIEAGRTDRIFNPASLLDGSAAGVAAMNAVCGRCHTRGKAVDPFHDTQVTGGFGFNQTDGVQKVLDAQDDFFVTTTKASDYWAYKVNPMFALPGDTYLASKSHRQQSLDMDAGGHSPHAGYLPNCVSCHDPHSVAQEHMIAGQVERGGVKMKTQSDDNSLCLACHAGHGDFVDVTREDVQVIASGDPPTAVVQGVVDHMKNAAAMPVANAQYDPDGSGVGRCTTCHMVETAKSGAWTEDAAGFQVGDIASHTFEPIWPRASELHGVTNSCNACHPLFGNDGTQTIIEEWSNPDADGDATFHADTPRSFQNGIANPERDGGVRCASCHTTEGFKRIQVGGEDPDQGAIDAMVKSAIAHDEGITCTACHGKQPDGTFAAGDNPLRFPAIDLCGRCHNNETVIFEDFDLHGEILRHPQREMLLGTAGEEIPGSGNYGSTAHSSSGLFPKGCVNCHFDEAAETEKHDFKPNTQTCNRCHSINSFDRPSPQDDADWDGNGAEEGIQTEVSGLLDLLFDKLLEDPRMMWNGSLFVYDGDSALAGASTAQKRAVFNWYSVSFDGSRGVHNAARSVQLLQRSYEDVAGFPVPGADLR